MLSCVRHRLLFLIATSLALGAVAIRRGEAGELGLPAEVGFAEHIKPILSDRCFTCHGPDAATREAGLRLDVPDSALGEASSGLAAIVPGDAEASELVRRITSDDPYERMPPADSKLSLDSREIALLQRWIEQGARWSEHWAFRAIAEQVAVPEATHPWQRSPIDAFVLRRLADRDVEPQGDASRERLIRRLAWDLTGLPPSLEEVDAFLADTRPGTYRRAVDRMLASPRFGERMAVPWLDAARYADTYGYQADRYRDVWPWRDWVVRALNANQPYDEFLTWQLAGDLLPDASRHGDAPVLATAFNRLHRQTNEGGSIEEEFRVEYVADRVNTLGAAALGLTLECAQCHDHKYDPVSQRDYYALAAMFDNIDESGLYSHFTDATPTPTLDLPTDAQRREIARLRGAVERAEQALRAARAEAADEFDSWYEATAEVAAAEPLAHYRFDSVDGDTVPSSGTDERGAKLSGGPESVAGAIGDGLRLDGENRLTTPVGGGWTRHDAFSIALWMRTPDVKQRAVVLHRSRAWTDSGSRGYQLLLEDGRLSASLIHFWPGNAVRIRTVHPLPVDRWTHVAFTYDGSSRAGGLRLYLDGRPVDCEVVRDGLTRRIVGGINGGEVNELTVGQRFRDRGFKGGAVDELMLFDRQLSAVEVAAIPGGDAAVALESVARADAEAHYRLVVDDRCRDAAERLGRLRRGLGDAVDAVDEIMVMRETDVPRETYVLGRGEYDARREPVEPGAPASVAPTVEPIPRNRLELAEWLTDPAHPLTARVAVNRYWQMLFGRGLVATPEDFGSQGEPPTHPELLDWLARRYIDSGWDTKALIRTIVLSSTYRQASRCPPELEAADPENAWLARGPRHRLSAEVIRDSLLSAAGLLSERHGGPPVRPFQPEGLWEEKSGAAYERQPGEPSHRRSLYTYWKRTSPPPSMLTFDAAKREVCVVERQTTATPLQALVLLNDPQYVEAARALAERCWHEAATAEERRRRMFRRLIGRTPSEKEAEVIAEIEADQRALFAAGDQSAAPLLDIGDHRSDPAIPPDELAALTVLAQALINHDEAVTKR